MMTCEDSFISSVLGLSMAEEEEDGHSLEAKFVAAVKVIRSLPEDGPFQPSDDMLLMFCSYYKQATLGPCEIPRPNGFWDSHGKEKWDAWSSLGNMTKKEAMKNYIEDIQMILETIPISDEVSDLVQKLGNFYTDGEREKGEAEDHEVDSRPFTRPFANHADELNRQLKKPAMEGWRPDPTLLMVNKRWRSDARGSSSSMEPSVCSFTNGTHSSLNSEVEEEELACSIEPSIEQYNSYMHFNGHPSGHSEVVPEKNRRSTDSDEEFCDSMEHLAMEEGLSTSRIRSPGSAAVSVRQRDHWFESNTTLNAGEDQVLMGDSYFKEGISASNNSSLSRRGRVPGSPLPGTPCDSQRSASVDAVCCCVSHSRYPVSVARENINEQIATALLRLQHDMSRVLHRLHSLEALTVSQSRSSSPKQEDALAVAQKFLRPAWWPFDFSPLTVVFTTLWPVVAHWLVQVYLQRRRRKIA
ncbi:acyl-CoA-binding domain-containing protein 5-B-like isoform X3 [Gymnodraco acuticeps]|uniref:Acyl-CoA-binding domain-containing protein 5 n=1 Tax=Gymnodraco acuticeps TaxID=8218 RepID=A0A6P8U2Y4_GYMAC|nr:acyl-CoA-binding domain-containing protein 5-B-like isoform X3 [Gymnodraco acuticeps]